MASAWITARTTTKGKRRHVVRYRVGGREAPALHWHSYARKREAVAARDYVAGELACGRVPDRRLAAAAQPVQTIAELVEAWRTSRVDVSAGTMQTYVVAQNRLVSRIGDVPVHELDAAKVAVLVAELHENGLRKQTIRKTVSVLAMALDHARIEPNPARDKLTVRLPREEREQVQPPTAKHVEAAVRLLPKRYRLPALVLDGTGMRISEVERLTWGDVDEGRGRWRVRAAVAKTGHARWVSVPPVIFSAVTALVPRDDRVPDRRVFIDFTGDRFRTALTRACTAAGVPSFSPHDLRHRRVSLLHLAGVPWARIGEQVGHDDITTTSRVYSHVLVDETELEYGEMLR